MGGEWRSLRLEVAARPGLRPTPDRVRETLFNWLGQALHGQRCLDLFAGSGALGFEAASRGAEVVMVECDALALRALRASRERLGAARVAIVAADAFDFLGADSGRFDVVFLDPPFRQNAYGPLLERLPPRLAREARVYVEAPVAIAPPPAWRELRCGRAGRVSYQLLQWSEHDRSGVSGDL